MKHSAPARTWAERLWLAFLTLVAFGVLVYGYAEIHRLASRADSEARHAREFARENARLRRVRVGELRLVSFRVCENISAPLRRLIGISDAALAGIAYYREHPEELAAAHSLNHQALVSLSRHRCVATSHVRLSYPDFPSLAGGPVRAGG